VRSRRPVAIAAIVSTGLCGSALALVALVALFACTSTDDVAAQGPDVVEAGLRETAMPDAAEAEPACDLHAELFAKVHDASIGDGASTTGLCLGCAKRACPDVIDKCTQDCPCQSIVGNALECYVTTQQLGCAGALADIFVTRETRRYAFELLGCVQHACALACVTDGGDDAGDAGEADAGL
jgi:hypothetical protein